MSKNIVDHPLKYAKEIWHGVIDDWQYLDAPYAEFGDPNGPPEGYHVVTLMPSAHLLRDRMLSVAYFLDGEHMFATTRPEMPLMRSWRAQPIHQTLAEFSEKYAEWSNFFFDTIDWSWGANIRIRAYRRIEQWDIDVHDEIGKQRILKDVADAYHRLIPDGVQ